MAERINLALLQIQSISNLIYLDNDIAKELEIYKLQKIDPAQMQQSIKNKIRKYNSGLNNIQFQAAILSENGELMGGTGQFQTIHTPFHITSDWFTQFSSHPSAIFWKKDKELDQLFSVQGYPYIYLIRQLHDLKTWKQQGILILGISEIEMMKMYSGYVHWDQSCYIFDRDNKLISHVDNINKGAHVGISSNKFDSYAGTFFVEKKSKRELVNFHTISSPQWKIATITDLRSQLKKFEDVFHSFRVILIFYLCFSIMISGIMARQFVRPINTLHESMKQVKEGNLNIQIPVSTNDEIGDLSEQFNEMLKKVKDLINNIVTEQKMKREAEILALQAQINPHFLYNTLASIRFLIQTGEKKTADNAILSLIHILKNTLSNANEFISVEREISLLQDYIQIQKLSFACPVDVTMNIDPTILDCRIIKLLLQPVVENAFLHGLKPKQGTDLQIRIEGKADREQLVFTVEDNGVGFNMMTTQLTDYNIHSRSIGIQNVHNRIVLTFGDDYGIFIQSKVTRGTSVKITLPLIFREGEYSSYEHSDRR